MPSPAELLASSGQQAHLLTALTPQELDALVFDWRHFWARPEQIAPPGDWFIWLIKTGRGWGKTRTGSEFVREQVESGEWREVALVNDTARDTRDIMVEGPSGILAVCPPWNKPKYEPSKSRVVWPSGAVAHLYAAEAPEALRGPQHDGAWADEAAKWTNLRKQDAEGGTAWDNLLFGLRTGPAPRCVVTTTPRAIAWMKALEARKSVVTVSGSSYVNRANLAPAYYEEVIAPYEGTRLGRQEIYGELLDDIEGALWQRAILDQYRVVEAPTLRRIVVAIDPAGRVSDNADETGIIVAGVGQNGHGYILADLSGKYRPDEWALKAAHAYHNWKADRIVAEINFGADMVGMVLRTAGQHLPFKELRASRGKRIRAEPVAALYEQGKVHHVGTLSGLEDQQCTWDARTNEASPDRVDALVWALTELMLEGRQGVAIIRAK